MSHYHCKRCYKYHTEGTKCPSEPPVSSSELARLVSEMLGIFNRVEVSDFNEREIHPTTVQSCSVMDAERLREIFIRMDRLTRPNTEVSDGR